MVKIDLSAEAAAEAIRLSRARVVAIETTAPQVDGALIYIARRKAVRRSLRGGVLLVWRLAYEDVTGRRVESKLVAVMLEPPRARWDARHADWSDSSLIEFVSRQGAAWRGMVEDTVHRFTATRLSREHAIAADAAVSTKPIQAGLFDRRAERARATHAQSGAHLTEQIAARAKAAASAGAISAQSPELLLVLIPRDAARM